MMDTGAKEERMDLESIIGQMGRCTLEISRIMNVMAMANCITQMESGWKEDGKMGRSKENVFTSGQMELGIISFT